MTVIPTPKTAPPMTNPNAELLALADEIDGAVSIGMVMYDPMRNDRTNRYLTDGEIGKIVAALTNPSQNAVTGSSGIHPVPEGAADNAPPAIQCGVHTGEQVAYRWRQPGNKYWIYDPTPEWIEDHRHEIELEALYAAAPTSVRRAHEPVNDPRNQDWDAMAVTSTHSRSEAPHDHD